ncbi:hypothetical protein [Cellulomonas sp.]|uniref:hypothetical protein n=1 Tax=Cellulomonas sp. TaxID=40001 RepID=UPI003BAD9935
MLPPHRPSWAAAPRGSAVVLTAALVLGTTVGCTSPEPAPDARSSASSSADDRARPRATDAPSGSPAPTPTTTGSSSDGGAAGALASEILPSQPPGPGKLSDLAAAPPGPSLTGPLPATGAANGAVVKGFPTEVVPILEGLTVVSSSVSSSGDRLQVGLQASSSSAPADVRAAYAAALGGAGFTESESPAVAGATAAEFTHGADGLVLTLRDRIGGGTELTLAGTLTTAG